MRKLFKKLLAPVVRELVQEANQSYSKLIEESVIKMFNGILITPVENEEVNIQLSTIKEQVKQLNINVKKARESGFTIEFNLNKSTNGHLNGALEAYITHTTAL
jgi:hypothetical protein